MEKERKRELSPMISQFLFLEEDATNEEKANYLSLKIEIRQLLKDDFNRKVLSEILLDLRKDISGEAQASLFKLYQDLGLHKDAFAKLKSRRWQVVSKGILDLTQMRVEESYGFITRFINDRRSTIRKQAEMATVTLKHEGINYFLDTTKYKISEWQQLKLLDVIRNKKDFQPPLFKAWLTSNNKHVVLFSLRLIKYYRQNDAKASLTELAKHKNNQIKEEAIACIKEFHVTEALDTLKTIFWKCKVDVKIAILDAIATLGTETDIEFLKLIDKKEANFSVKSKALSSINAISPESIMPSRGILDTSNYKIPEDITEAVAKVHAAEHLKLAADDPEEEHLEPEEMLRSQEELQNEFDEALDPELVELKEIQVQAEVVPTKKGWEHFYDLEVAYDIETGLEPMEEKTEEEINLDFLPLVVTSETEILPKSVNDAEVMEIKVVYEEVSAEAVDVVEHPIESDEQESSNMYPEFAAEELYFLPIVVENDVDLEENRNIGPVSKEGLHVSQLEVVFEALVPDEQAHTEQEKLLEFEMNAVEPMEGDDHPLVEGEKRKTNAFGFDRYNTSDILNSRVTFEEILGRPALVEVSIRDIEVNEPQVVKEDDIVSDELPSNSKITEEMTEQEEKQLLDIVNNLIDFDDREQGNQMPPEFQEWPSLDFEIAEGALEFLPVVAENECEEEPINIPRASIPKAIFGDIEFEASTRQLLNDLEEMGDQREIPLLRELLEHSKYEPFQNRINELMETFGGGGSKAETSKEALKPFSVFQDLFRTCDTDAKLILLDEVVEVGDEKELGFLNDLLTDDEPRIKRKAHKVLEALKERLGKECSETEPESAEEIEGSQAEFSNLLEELEIGASKASDIFDLNFEFTVNEDENGLEVNPIERNDTIKNETFFSQICSFSNKIFEKLNG